MRNLLQPITTSPGVMGFDRSWELLDPARSLDEHAEQPEQLALMVLLDDESALDRREELPVDLLGHRLQQARHQQLHAQALLSAMWNASIADARRAAPADQARAARRRGLRQEQVAALLTGLNFSAACRSWRLCNLPLAVRGACSLCSIAGGEVVCRSSCQGG